MAERKAVTGSRFMYGERPAGFGAQFYLEADGSVIGALTLHIEKEGPPGHAHGGSLASVLDEVMGNAAWFKSGIVLAANLNINYKRPVPLDTSVTVRGWVARVEGRKNFTESTLTLPDGTVAVTGTGLFITLDQTQSALKDSDGWQEFGMPTAPGSPNSED